MSGSGKFKLYVLVGVMASLVMAQALAQEGARGGPAAFPGPFRPGLRDMPSRGVSELIRRGDEIGPLAVCEAALKLSADQETQLEQLVTERQEELQRLQEKLDKQFAERAKELLTENQGRQYEQVLAALAKYRQSVDAAEAEMAEAVDEGLAKQARTGSLRPGRSLIYFLDLPPRQRQALARVRIEAAKKMAKAREAVAQPTDRTDREAMRQYREKIMQAVESAKAEAEVKQKALLTPEQKARLAKVEEALEAFSQKKKTARKTLSAELVEALRTE